MTTKNQKISIVSALFLAFVLGIGMMCGCSCFTPEKVAAIHKTVGTILDIAYATGGAALVEQKIDKLATDGKITRNQADILKAAARKSYADLQKRLKELSVADIEVSAEK